MNLNTLSFTEVIRKFENYYGVRITIDNPEDMPELKYHGKIRVSSPRDVIRQAGSRYAFFKGFKKVRLSA